MRNQQIRWLGAAILMPVLIGLGTASCEDTSIWDVNSMVGKKKSVCQADIDCDDKNDCTEDTCNAAGLCEYLVLPNASSCDDGNVCTVDRCDIHGRCQNELDTSITFNTNNPCVLISCEFGAADPAKPLPNGAPCESDSIPLGAGYCYQATCYSCKDGLKNGDESGIDCGGANCPSCAAGQSCNQDSECLTGHCVDGVCCDAACDTLCYSCNLPGSLGKCAPVALLDSDINPDPLIDCADPYRCDGLGTCKASIGIGCAAHADCLTDYCYAAEGICQLNIDAFCTADPKDCYTDHCDLGTNRCAFIPLGDACIFDAQCGNGFCYTTPNPDICKLANGTPCQQHAQCSSDYCNAVTGTCTLAPLNHICLYNEQCQSDNCYTALMPHQCKLKLGDPCMASSQCSTDLCWLGTCFLKPTGQPCIANDQCASGLCDAGACT